MIPSIEDLLVFKSNSASSVGATFSDWVSFLNCGVLSIFLQGPDLRFQGQGVACF